MSQALKVLEDLAINNDITGLIAKKEADLNDMTGKDIVSLVERENEKDTDNNYTNMDLRFL